MSDSGDSWIKKTLLPPHPFEERVPKRSRQIRFKKYIGFMEESGYKIPAPKTGSKLKQGRPQKGYYVEAAESAALAMMMSRPDWSLREIAEFIGCNVKQLYRSQLVKRYRQLLRSGKQDVLAGFVDPDTGDMDAWEYDRQIYNATARRIHRKPLEDDEGG